MSLSRRSLLSLFAGLPLRAAGGIGLRLPVDGLQRAREQLRRIIDNRYIAFDLRALDEGGRELFRIQHNEDMLLPVASCFKAFVVPWYYLNVPPEERDDGPESAMWDMAVHSGNYFTSVVLDQVAERVPGEGNAIEKFNDFLLSIGLQNGLYQWRVGRTKRARDERFRPSPDSGRMVRVDERRYAVFNVFTARDLAQGYGFLVRGEGAFQGPQVADALERSRSLLGRPERVVRSPIERVWRPGYTGKQGIIFPQDIPTGYVFNDAGLVNIGGLQYIIAFMSVAQYETVAMTALREVVRQAILLERELSGAQTSLQSMPRIHG